MTIMFFRIFQPQVLIFLIPIVAICGHYILKAHKMRYEHEERLAKIENGINPDDETI